MKPSLSFTVWFSQRNGSSLLCEGLASTDVAGKPGEHFLVPTNTSLLDFYHAKDYEELQQKIWQKGMTANGVFGIKVQAPKKNKDAVIHTLANFPGIEESNPTNYNVWENAFPHGKHIFLTRRNKGRQSLGGKPLLLKSGTGNVEKNVLTQHLIYNTDIILRPLDIC